MWQKVMSRVHEGLEDKDFFSCSGLTYVSVCADSGLLATENCAMDCRGSLRLLGAGGRRTNAPLRKLQPAHQSRLYRGLRG